MEKLNEKSKQSVKVATVTGSSDNKCAQQPPNQKSSKKTGRKKQIPTESLATTRSHGQEKHAEQKIKDEELKCDQSALIQQAGRENASKCHKKISKSTPSLANKIVFGPLKETNPYIQDEAEEEEGSGYDEESNEDLEEEPTQSDNSFIDDQTDYTTDVDQIASYMSSVHKNKADETTIERIISSSQNKPSTSTLASGYVMDSFVVEDNVIEYEKEDSFKKAMRAARKELKKGCKGRKTRSMSQRQGIEEEEKEKGHRKKKRVKRKVIYSSDEDV